MREIEWASESVTQKLRMNGNLQKTALDSFVLYKTG